MSEKDYALRATLKAGDGFSAPWLTVGSDDPVDLAAKLSAITNGDIIGNLIEAANTLRAAENAAGIQKNGAEAQAPAQQQGGWKTQPQQQAPQQGGGQQHPEGKQCSACGTVLLFKQVNRKSDGKTFKFWACPNQKSRNDGHDSEFAN